MLLSNIETTFAGIRNIFKHNIMDDLFANDERIFSDEDLLLGNADEAWNCDGCPPPVFNLPPPPRPPWLEDLDDCGSKGSITLSEMLSSVESCDNTIIRDSHTLFEDTFHSVAVIVVSAIVLVMVVLVAAIMIFKRRKRLHNRECHPSHPLVSDLHQRTLPKEIHPDNSRFLVAENINNANGMFNFTMVKNQTCTKSINAVTALTRNGHTMTRCCGNLEAHFQRHYNAANNQANSLPNHYIPDQPAFPRISEVRPRLSVPERTIMELSERPPQLRPPNVIPPNAYPHIIIGGKPFYLIPSSGDPGLNDGSFESYSYPQHVPIYEEIDGGSRFYEAASEMDFSSEQGEVGSIERLAHNVDSISRSPRPFRTMFAGSRDATPQHRPVSSATSHSQNSSQQTTTSDISSSSSSTASTSNPNLSAQQQQHHHQQQQQQHHHQQQQQQHHQHYVVLDPDMDDPKKKPNSLSSLYENSISKTSNRSPKLNRSIRLADGVERCRSPQSIYSARLANKVVSQCNSPNRSVYYYSDTLKRDNSLRQEKQQSPIKEGDEVVISDISMDSDFDNSSSNVKLQTVVVETVIVLDDPKTKGTATLV